MIRKRKRSVGYLPGVSMASKRKTYREKATIYLTIVSVTALLFVLLLFAISYMSKENPNPNPNPNQSQDQNQSQNPNQDQNQNQNGDDDGKGGSDIEIKSTFNMSKNVIPIVVVACDRPQYLERCLDRLMEIHKNGFQDRFPIYVSQDCVHKTLQFEQVSRVVKKYPKIQSLVHPSHTDLVQTEKYSKKANVKMTAKYSFISEHYRFILTTIFDDLHYDGIIIVEDDMELSVDFLEYFSSMYEVLKRDSSLFCVSSWNDQGMKGYVEDPKAIYRTDIFPGLGWMILKPFWDEIKNTWPPYYWDEFLRNPEVRKNRQCLFPEISRNHNFGRVGSSVGEYYDDYIVRVEQNQVYYNFSNDLDYLVKSLSKEDYDLEFFEAVNNAPIVQFNDIDSLEPGHGNDLRIIYKSKSFDQFQIQRKTIFMPEFKENLPRSSYKGVVTFHRNGYRVFISPPGIIG